MLVDAVPGGSGGGSSDGGGGRLRACLRARARLFCFVFLRGASTPPKGSEFFVRALFGVRNC